MPIRRFNSHIQPKLPAVILSLFLMSSTIPASTSAERQVTQAAQNHILTNIGAWSPDSQWIVYDTRQSLDGSVFNGVTIERIEVATGKVDLLYRSSNQACCGVVTYHPAKDQVVFIHGPEHPNALWQYSPARRQGVIVDCSRPGVAIPLDARDLSPPFTPGALRGGTHVHTFSPNGLLVTSTYEDAVLQSLEEQSSASGILKSMTAERNLRGIAISLLGHPVDVPLSHPRNHSGTSFSVLATRLHDSPISGSDQIMRACEEGWIGSDGYRRADGGWQRHALAFQGTVVDHQGQPLVELFVLDLPDNLEDLLLPSEGALQGTTTTRPLPPQGIRQRRITHTEGRKHPGVSAPRHWVRTSSDGSNIAFLAKDDQGVVQIYSVSPLGGPIRPVTRDQHSVSSTFSFSPDGQRIAYVADSSIFVVELDSGQSRRLTSANFVSPPRPEACVFSPDGKQIAFMRTIQVNGNSTNQIFVVDTN